MACDSEHMRATAITNAKRAKKELPPFPAGCAFCRTAHPTTEKELVDRIKAKVGDPFAIYNYGMAHRDGRFGLPKNDTKALELFHQSADMGCVDAMSELGAI